MLGGIGQRLVDQRRTTVLGRLHKVATHAEHWSTSTRKKRSRAGRGDLNLINVRVRRRIAIKLQKLPSVSIDTDLYGRGRITETRRCESQCCYSFDAGVLFDVNGCTKYMENGLRLTRAPLYILRKIPNCHVSVPDSVHVRPT